MFTQTVTRALSHLGLNQRGTDPHPRQPAPMLLQKADAMFSSTDWTYEPKWDGFRILATVRDGSVRLVSRNGHSFTNLFGPVSDALRGFLTSILFPPRWVRPTLAVEVEYRQRLKEATSCGPQGSQAGEEAGGDPAFSDE